ncbi:MAG: DJ-1/PfpI family protein [DPANN group archaeon]|nr:DJ-1/PfpI family protein [DPANN group archaeon]
MAKALFVIAPENFRDEEYFKPKEILEKAGHIVITASTKRGICKGMLGGKAKTDILIGDAIEDNFDSLVVIGGSGSTKLWDLSELQQLFHAFYDANKPIAAICLATVALMRSGLTQGKRVTGWSPEANIEAAKQGAQYTNAGVEEDDLFITGKGPEFAEQFGRKILKRLQK